MIGQEVANKKKQRDSNMEMLRIVAMFFVMVVHAGFLALGVPTHNEAVGMPLITIIRFLVQAFSSTCVILFVLISGWYGINFKKEKLLGLIFQILFFSILVYVCLVIYDKDSFVNFDKAGTIILMHPSDYWFIKSYVLLYLISPLLNSFVASVSEKQLRTFLILFYVIQTIYGWVFLDGFSDFGGGYSVFSFMGLYLLARYMRLYPIKRFNLSARMNLGIFVLIGLSVTFLAFGVTYLNIPISGRLFTYTCPFIILESIFLLKAFSKMKFKSKAINWIASSCLAVYLLHANELVLRTFYGKIIKEWFVNEQFLIFVFYVLTFIILIYAIAIIIDKVRMYLWRLIVSFSSKEKHI
jgi:surface polysaccharide O-acyltransferase-like enzyme